MKIIFLAPYPPGKVASQRFRFEQYFTILKEKKIRYRFLGFYPSWSFEVLYREGHCLKKWLGTAAGYFRRLYHLLFCFQADYIMVHRELTPLGPPVFEWTLIFVLRKRIIFDFDDAIWISDELGRNKWLDALRYHRKKFNFLCRKSYRISAGNPYLARQAEKYHAKVTVNPTTLDTRLTRSLKTNHLKPTVTIGWTGSHSTLKYLEYALPVLKKILQRFRQTRLLIICNRKPVWELRGMEFIYWNKTTEWEDLSRIQIGIMPLPDNPWTRGKGGFKIMEYFSLGIPALAAPVGINKALINHGLNGFLCENESDWIHYLEKLIQDPSLRIKMGQAGRILVEERFSLESNLANFLDLFA